MCKKCNYKIPLIFMISAHQLANVHSAMGKNCPVPSLASTEAFIGPENCG